MWFMYVLECSDGSLYAGVTTNLERRVREHNQSNKGAKYTRSRRPVRLIGFEEHLNRSQSQKAESAFKKLSKTEKEKHVCKIREPAVGDIVLVKSAAGEVIPKIHVKLLKRVIVKPQKGKFNGFRYGMDWPGYSGWEATPVYKDEIDILRKQWSIPFTNPGEDITFVYDDLIIKIASWAKKSKKSRRRVIRKVRKKNEKEI